MAERIQLSRLEQAALAVLLSHQYGDGYVLVRSRDERILLKKAIGLGLVDREGCVTGGGDRFLAQWADRASVPAVRSARRGMSSGGRSALLGSR